MKAMFKKLLAAFGLAVVGGIGTEVGTRLARSYTPKQLPSFGTREDIPPERNEVLMSDAAVPPDRDEMNKIMEALRRKGE